ncbi:MAG: hypothetical protein SVZ03_12215 [Spirochaetota bacterium]|nr:hypothetical protein [Spirochaetota bacterium]
MKRLILILSSAFIIFNQVACTTNYNQIIKDSERTFYRGNYKKAAKKLLPLVNKKSRDQLILMMECGMMLHASGDYENSNKVLLEAAKLSETITTSIRKQAAALLLNETKTNYKGEDFERVLIHMYLGINFIMLQKVDEARVEFKKVNDLLRDINVSVGKKYKQNIMAKYLTAITFEITADIDNDEGDKEYAYIEYKQIHSLYPKLSLVYRDLQRLSKQLGDKEDYTKWVTKFGKRDNLPKDAGELIMFFQAGRGAVKVSRGSLLKDRSMKNGITVSLNGMPLKAGVTIVGVLAALKIAKHPIPIFKKRSNKINHLVISVNEKDIGRTYELENIENTAIKNMEDDYQRMYMKVAAGIAVKAATSVAAGIAAKKLAEQSKKLSGFAGLIGALAGIGAGATLVSQIEPDLRCWHTLPSNLQLSRIFLPAGMYELTIKYIDHSGRVEKTKNTMIEIKKGKKSFLNYRTLY